MALIFSDNFDGEDEGTSPPVNWFGDSGAGRIPSKLEVDDARFVSSPHSMLIASDPGNNAWVHHNEAGGWTDEITGGEFWIAHDPGESEWYFVTQSTVGDMVTNNLAIYCRFSADGDIDYYDGIWNDSGYNWTGGDWRSVEATHDLVTDTFDMWYEGVQVINGGGFRNAVATIKNLTFVVSFGSDNDLWVDDVYIGEEPEGWLGTYLGVENPAKINGVAKESVTKVNGVQSA